MPGLSKLEGGDRDDNRAHYRTAYRVDLTIVGGGFGGLKERNLAGADVFMSMNALCTRNM
jgi:hypothetical protein